MHPISDNNFDDAVSDNVTKYTYERQVVTDIYSNRSITPSSFCKTATTFPSKPSKSPPLVATKAPESASSSSSGTKPSKESTFVDAISKAWILETLPSEILWICKRGQSVLPGNGG